MSNTNGLMVQGSRNVGTALLNHKIQRNQKNRQLTPLREKYDIEGRNKAILDHVHNM